MAIVIVDNHDPRVSETIKNVLKNAGYDVTDTIPTNEITCKDMEYKLIVKPLESPIPYVPYPNPQLIKRGKGKYRKYN